MKKLSLLLSVCLVLFFGAAVAGAKTTQSSTTASSTVERNWNYFRPETLSGTVTMVDAQQHLIVLTSGGIPYNFKVTKATHIKVAGNKATFRKLSNQDQKEASVTFVARANGDFARNITVTQQG